MAYSETIHERSTAMFEIFELVVATFLYVIVSITDALFGTSNNSTRKH